MLSQLPPLIESVIQKCGMRLGEAYMNDLHMGLLVGALKQVGIDCRVVLRSVVTLKKTTSKMRSGEYIRGIQIGDNKEDIFNLKGIRGWDKIARDKMRLTPLDQVEWHGEADEEAHVAFSPLPADHPLILLICEQMCLQEKKVLEKFLGGVEKVKKQEKPTKRKI